MPRGYFDWLIPESQGQLATYRIQSNYTQVTTGLGFRYSLFNSVGSAVLARLLRAEFRVKVRVLWAPPQLLTLDIHRSSLAGPGTVSAPVRHDNRDPLPACQYRESIGFVGGIHESFALWQAYVVNQTWPSPANGPGLIPDVVLYEHLADGRRQPITLSPGEGIVVRVTNSDDHLDLSCLYEWTEEPIL